MGLREAAGAGVAAAAAGWLLFQGGRQILPRLDQPSLSGMKLLISLTVMGCLLVPFFVFSSPGVVRRLRRAQVRRWSVWHFIPAALLAVYLPYWALVAGAPRQGLVRLAVAVGVPWFLARFWPARLGGEACVFMTALSIWMPLEFGWTDAAFPWPDGAGGRAVGILLGLDLLLYLLLVVRGVEGTGYRLGIRWRDLPYATGAFVVFALVAVPIGLGTGFLSFQVRGGRLPEFFVAGVALFLITGVPEETLFRGVLQGLLERWTGRPVRALLLSSFLFGAAHANNGGFPDWRYMGLASLAGLAYGWVYQRTRRIGPAALTHALVDLTWLAFF